MKIAIVGAGNAGCVTALELLHSKEPCDITIYHNPKEYPIERVGQGSFPSLPLVLFNVLNIDWYNNPIDMTIKTGILYEGWGKKKDKQFHPFDGGYIASHFVPQKLSNLVLESGLVKVIEKTIGDPEKEIEADVIFDCRGRHNRDKDNYDEIINPINAVLLYNKPGKDSSLTYTKSVATPNGWVFIIPNKNSVSYGYLYNRDITKKYDAAIDFLERFDLPNIDGSMEFDNYVAKNMFTGKKTILQGNAYGFVEPLEATAIGFYQNLCNQAKKTIYNGKDKRKVNDKMRSIMNRIETFILWHYQFGSKYDTPFWKYAKSLPFNPDDTFKEIIGNIDGNTKGLIYNPWTNVAFKVWKEYVIK
jgi:tryptophan halogenase